MYLEQFEEMKGLLIQITSLLLDSFFVDSFVGDLKTQLKPFVKALNPVTLIEAMNLARLQEEALEAWRIPNRVLTSRPPLLPNPKTSFSVYTPT